MAKSPTQRQAGCREERIDVLLINPGWVKTSIGGKNAPMSSQKSAGRVRENAEKAEIPENHAIHNHDDECILL